MTEGDPLFGIVCGAILVAVVVIYFAQMYIGAFLLDRVGSFLARRRRRRA